MSQDDVYVVHSELPVVSSPPPGMGVLQVLQDALRLIQYWGKNGKYGSGMGNIGEQQYLQWPHL